MFERHLMRAPAIARTGAGEVVGVEVGAVPLAVGTGLAERRDRDHHQARVVRGQGGVVQIPGAHLRGQVVLDQHIGLAHQIEEQAVALRVLDLAGDAALVGVVEEEQTAAFLVGQVARVGAAVACGIARAGFDLDHVGAVVGEQTGAMRGGDALAKVDHAQAGERAWAP